MSDQAKDRAKSITSAAAWLAAVYAAWFVNQHPERVTSWRDVPISTGEVLELETISDCRQVYPFGPDRVCIVTAIEE